MFVCVFVFVFVFADLGEGVCVGTVADHLLGDLGGVQQAVVHPGAHVDHAVGVARGRVHS